VVIQVLARLTPGSVERLYSRRLYPLVQKIVSGFTDWTVWSIAEWLLILLAAVVALKTVFGLRALLRGRRTLRSLSAHALSLSLAATGLVYTWGVFSWGLNYQRIPFATSAGFDTSPATPLELALLCTHLAEQAADLRSQVLQDGEGVMLPRSLPIESLERVSLGFEDVWPDYPELHGAPVSRAKAVRLPALSWLNIGGVFSMFTSEPNVNMHQPAHSILASSCHETAHQAGWAREEEASFVGFVACRRHPEADFRYATTQSALASCVNSLSRVDGAATQELLERIDPGIRRDWAASHAYWSRFDTPIGDAAQRVNDAYLKSQGQQAGIESYGLLVDLLIGDRRRDGVRSSI